MRRFAWLGSTLLLSLAVVAACGGGSEDPSPSTVSAGGGMTTASGGASPTPSSSSIGGAGGGVPDQSAAAQCPIAPDLPITPMGAGLAEGAIDFPGERDHYRFIAPAGVWTSIHTTAVGADLNAVVRVYDGTGTELLATVDDHRPVFEGFDAWMYFVTPSGGTFCIEVLSQEDWRGVETKAGGDQSYRLHLTLPESPWSQTPGFGVEDTEPNDTVAEAQVIDGEGALITGELSSTDDRDVYAFTGNEDPLALRFVISGPSGPGGDGFEGWGSGDDSIMVSVLASDGVTVLSRHRPIDLVANCDGPRGCGSVVAEPATHETLYIVVERDPNAPASSNATYSLISLNIEFTGFDLEGSDDGTNDTRAGAAIPSLLPDVEGFPGYSFEGELGDGDTDWWHIPLSAADEVVGVWCGSALWGSGVEGFQVEAIAADDVTGTVVRSEVESTAQALRWGPSGDLDFSPSQPGLAGGGGYDLKLTASAWDATNTSRRYFCRISLQPVVQ